MLSSGKAKRVNSSRVQLLEEAFHFYVFSRNKFLEEEE